MLCVKCKDKNLLIECECGCHRIINSRDRKNRIRTFVQHHAKGWTPKTGKQVLDAKGYAMIFKPFHVRATKAGYVKHHRLVMETYLSICLGYRTILDSSLVIHHRNKDRKDNRLENLELMTVEMHNNIEQGSRNTYYNRWTGQFTTRRLP